MKDKDFQQLVDRAFAPLEWTDAQRLHTLKKMHKEERTVMKRKLIVTLVAAMLLLPLTGTAVAAGLNITTLKDFFDLIYAEVDLEGNYQHIGIDESAVVKPVSQRHTSALVDAQVEEMYLTNDRFYFTIRYTPKAANTLLFSSGVTSVMLDGEEKDYWDLWDRKDLLLLEPYTQSIDDPLGRRDPIQLLTSDRVRDPETGAITEMFIFTEEEELFELRSISGGTLMLNFRVFNLSNHDIEQNVLYVDFPQMEMVENDPLHFTAVY